MKYDLLVRGGRVVDGSGMPSFLGDVGVKDGKVVEIGHLTGDATRAIDANGLVVAPGFIDHHTHLDAQIFWDPYGTSEPQNGVTSVVMGNCGLTFAPVKEGDSDSLIKSFVRVEAMNRRALELGIPWGWRTYRDYLDAVSKRLGINVGGLVGHIALRQYAMGEESTEREARPEEIDQMRELLHDALRGGALGMSTNRNQRHIREDGKPVASRLAGAEEVFALGGVLHDLNAGVIETVHETPPRADQLDWYEELARRTERPIVWQAIQHRWDAPDLWREQLERVGRIFQAGYRAYATANTITIVNRFTLKNAQVFDEFPTWKNIMFLPDADKKLAFSSAETRTRLRAELAEPRLTTFHRRWDLVKVMRVAHPDHQSFVGKTVQELSQELGKDPLDAFLDLCLEEDLETTFRSAGRGGDPAVIVEILRSPYVLIGVSDAGAHAAFDAAFGYGTTLLGTWVREYGALSLEEAVKRLTFQVASIYEIRHRGLLRPDYAADLVIFDAATIDACEPDWAEDYPGGTRRMVQASVGIKYTIVNGQVICVDGQLTGEMPGQVLRGSAFSQ